MGSSENYLLLWDSGYHPFAAKADVSAMKKMGYVRSPQLWGPVASYLAVLGVNGNGARWKTRAL